MTTVYTQSKASFYLENYNGGDNNRLFTSL